MREDAAAGGRHMLIDTLGSEEALEEEIARARAHDEHRGLGAVPTEVRVFPNGEAVRCIGDRTTIGWAGSGCFVRTHLS